MDPVQGNYHVSDQSLFRSPNKRFREGEDIIGRKNLQIALNTVSREESDRLTSVAKPNPVSTGLRLSYDDDERNSTVTSANGGLPSLPVVTFLGENLKNEFESQTEELDRYLRVQVLIFVILSLLFALFLHLISMKLKVYCGIFPCAENITAT